MVRLLSEGKNIKGEWTNVSVSEEEYKLAPIELLETGFYRLIRLEIQPNTPKKATEEFGLVKVRFTRNTLYYDRKKDEFVIYAKNILLESLMKSKSSRYEN